MNFLCFQEKYSSFARKGSISGGFRRRVEVQRNPGHQEQGTKRQIGKARPCIKAHGPTAKSHQHRPARKLARLGRAGWHDRAPKHGKAVLPGTAVPGGAAPV